MDHLGVPNELPVTPSLVGADPFTGTRMARFESGSAGTLRVLCQRWPWGGAISTPSTPGSFLPQDLSRAGRDLLLSSMHILSHISRLTRVALEVCTLAVRCIFRRVNSGERPPQG